MPSDVAHAIFDAYMRDGRVPVERAGAWPDEVAEIGGTYDGDPEEWIMCAVCQDWVPMPADVQDRLGRVHTYSEGASVLRRRWAGFDVP
jgi:hypothetical protein